MSNKVTNITRSVWYALVASVTIVTMLASAYFMFEPSISRGQASDTASFYVRQTITGESSFSVAPADITMTGSIAGITGGQATGTTQFVVTSNNSAGYYVEIAFENNGTPEAMVGDTSVSEAIRDYGGDVTGEPSFGFTASTAAQFAYSVKSTTTSDTDTSFHNNGANCNTGALETGFCWKSPATSGFRIVDRSASAVTGATSTLYFSVVVPSSANPVPVADTYTATATLSLFEK